MAKRMLYSIMLGAALAVVAFTSGCNRSNDPQEEFTSAIKKEQAGDLRAAYLHAKSALQAAPEDAEGRWLLGRLEAKGGFGPSAEKNLLRALSLGAKPVDAVQWVARALLLQAEYERVIAGEPAKLVANSLSRPEPSASTRAIELALIGHAHANLGAIEAAVATYRNALALAPENGEALYGLGAAAAHAKRDDEARDWLERATKVEPDLANAWTTLGDLEVREKHFEKAAEAFGKAAALRLDNDSDLFMRFYANLNTPNYEAANADLQTLQKTGTRPAWKNYASGLFAFHQKKYPAARDSLRAAVASEPDFLAALGYLGYTEFLLGNLEQARSHLGAVAARSPSDSQLAASLAAIELRLKNYERASELAAEALALDPNSTLATDVLGSAAAATGNNNMALQQFGALVSKAPDSWTALTKLGFSHLEAGNLDKGFSELEAAVNLASNRIPVRVALAQAYMRAGRYDAAAKIGQQMQAEYPDSAIGWMLEGGAALSKRDISAASKIFTTTLERFPGDPSAGLSLAAIALGQRDLKEARRLYEQILKAHPEHTATALKMADLDLAERRFTEAISAAQKVLNQYEDHSEATVILAKGYAAQGDFEKAIDVLEEPAKNQPGSTAAGLLGEAILASGDFEQAIPILIRLAKENPASAEARYVLARAYASAEDPSRAIEALRETLELKAQPNTAVGVVRLLITLNDLPSARKALDNIRIFLKDEPVLAELDSQIELGKGNFPRGEKMLTEAHARFPKDRAIALLLARARSRTQSPDAGLIVVTDWLNANPDDIDARVLRADLLTSLKRIDEAITEYKWIADKAPQDIQAVNNLAWLLKDSDPDEAISWAEKAAQAAPNSPAVLDTLGTLVLAKGNDHRRAVEVLEKANELAPKIVEIQVHLAEAYIKQGKVGKAENLLAAVLAVESTGSSARRATELLDSIK